MKCTKGRALGGFVAAKWLEQQRILTPRAGNLSCGDGSEPVSVLIMVDLVGIAEVLASSVVREQLVNGVLARELFTRISDI